MRSKSSAVFLVCICVGMLKQAAAQTVRPPQAPVVIRWEGRAAGADSYFKNGLLVKSLSAEGITVTASLKDTGWKTCADVSVANNSNARVDVLPAHFTLTLQRGNSKGKHQMLRYQDPAKMAKSLRRRVLWANVFTGAAAGAARETSTSTSTSSTSGSVDIYDNSGGSGTGTFDARTNTTTMTTKPDYRAQRNAQEAERARVQNLASALAYLDKVALKADTLMPSESVSGAVYFERDKHHKPVVLTIPVGNITFEFPFAWEKK